MALIPCPDCGHQVSSNAPSCVQCGAPIASRSEGHVQTVQATGKTWKLMQVLGAVSMVLGVSVCAISLEGPGPADGLSATSGLAFVVGLLLVITGRIGAWWNHG